MRKHLHSPPKLDTYRRFFAGPAGLVTLGVLAGAVSTPTQAQNGTAQAVNWQPLGQQLSYTLASGGQTTVLTLSVYKSPPTNDGLDWYLVAGPFTQSTTPSSGWTGTAMDLDILGRTEDGWGIEGQNATLYDAIPASTQFTNEKTLDISASLGIGLEGPTAGAGVSGSSTLLGQGTVTVGTVNAGNEVNLHFQYSTTSSVTMQYAAVFNVRHGQGLFLQITPDSWWDPPKGSTTNQYTQGFVVADFGAAPVMNSRGQTIQPATGPQILAMANGQCMKGGLKDQSVYLLACESNDASERWYYAGSGQIVNVETGYCLDIHAGATIGQGENPSVGTDLVTDECASPGTQNSQNWQIGTTPKTGVGMVIQGLGNYVASISGSNGKLVLAAPLTQYVQNATFYLQ